MEGIIKDITTQDIIISIDNSIYSLPTRIYDKYSFLVGDKVEGEINIDKNYIEYFEPKHPLYNFGEVYEFQIKDIFTKNDKNIIVVLDCYNNTINVYGLKWQKKEIFTKSTLKCEIVGFTFGRPKLKDVDFWHPFYEVGKEYKFDFLGVVTKPRLNGEKIDLIQLKGLDGCIHETPPIPSQFGHKFKPHQLKCKIISISYFIKLQQTEFIDPYFSKIEHILNCDGQLIAKNFYSLKDDLKLNSNAYELFKQYESNSSLWTITYCNKILPDKIFTYVNRFDFKSAITAIDILLKIESWILNSGLLDSFKREETKTTIKLKSETFIGKFEKMKKSFELIQSNEFDVESIEDINDKLLITAYYLRFNKIELIDFRQLFLSLKNIIQLARNSYVDHVKLNSLISLLEVQKNQLKKDELEIDFAIGKYKRVPFSNEKDLVVYLRYTVIQIYSLDLIDEKTRRNLYLSEFYKYLSIHYETDSEKRNCLKLAFYFCTDIECCVSLDVNYLINFNDLKYLSQLISSDISLLKNKENEDEWKKITRLKVTNDIIHVKFTKREKYGFIGDYNGIKCVLPSTNILSTNLKRFGESTCEIILSVFVVETFYNFNIILVKECNPSQIGYHFENLLSNKIEIGDIIKARVKAIDSYGVFLSTFAGEGLLHISNITDYFNIDFPLNKLFEIDEEFYVKVLNKTVVNKIEFGLKQLKGTDQENDYLNIELRIFAPELFEFEKNEATIVNSSFEIKKRLFIQGHLFEYFSDLQYDYEGKIKYLKLSKIYYSALQSSRSYFLNTYINYFDILNDIENAISKKSKFNVDEVIIKSDSLYNNLNKNTQSLEKFPSVYRLIFFLDVLRQFNNTSINSLKILFEYILGEHRQEWSNIQRVAKVVLSNNVILSEINDDDFMLKNLRIVYQFLKEGVFDIADNELERKQRELKERIAHIRNKIFNEESEKVEFKSSLIKPILDVNRSKRLRELQEKSDSKSKSEIENFIGFAAKRRIVHSAMKTLVAFANSKGGELFIGINDEGEFLGLSNDYGEIGIESRDELGKRLDEYINSYIGNSFFGLIHVSFEAIDNKDILIINVNESEEEIFLVKDENANKCSDFYIRRHSSSVKLEGKELIDYYKMKNVKLNLIN